MEDKLRNEIEREIDKMETHIKQMNIVMSIMLSEGFDVEETQDEIFFLERKIKLFQLLLIDKIRDN